MYWHAFFGEYTCPFFPSDLLNMYSVWLIGFEISPWICVFDSPAVCRGYCSWGLVWVVWCIFVNVTYKNVSYGKSAVCVDQCNSDCLHLAKMSIFSFFVNFFGVFIYWLKQTNKKKSCESSLHSCPVCHLCLIYFETNCVWTSLVMVQYCHNAVCIERNSSSLRQVISNARELSDYLYSKDSLRLFRVLVQQK